MSGAQFCQHCGRQFSPTGKYCQGCGKPRPAGSAQTPPTSPSSTAPTFANPVQSEKKVIYKPVNPNANRPVFTPPPVQPTQPVQQVPVQPPAPKPAQNIFVPPQAKSAVTLETDVIEWKRKPKAEKVKVEKEKSERVGFSAKTPIIVGVVALLLAGGAIWYTTKPDPVQPTAAATPTPSPTASEQAAVEVPADPSPTPNATKKAATATNAACGITSSIVNHLVDYANIARSVPGGSNDKNNAPVIIEWAQSASGIAMQVANDQSKAKGKVAPLLGKAANDLGDYANLILSWGKNQVENPSTFVSDYTSGQKQILADYRAIAGVCSGMVPSA